MNFRSLALVVLPIVCLQAKSPMADWAMKDACPGIETNGQIVQGSGILILNVTFFRKQPTKPQADKAGRTYLARAIQWYPHNDIMVTTWFRKGPFDDPNNDDQIEPYPNRPKTPGRLVGPMALVYHAGTGKVGLE